MRGGGDCRFLFLLLRKNKQKSSMPATHRRKTLPWFTVSRCRPARLGVRQQQCEAGGWDGSTLSDGKSCVSIGRGTPGCACHLVSMVQCFLVFYWPLAPASQLNGCSHTGIPHLSSQESRIFNYPLCFIQKKGDCQPEIFPETVFLESDLRYFISLPILHPAPSPRMVSSSIFT